MGMKEKFQKEYDDGYKEGRKYFEKMSTAEVSRVLHTDGSDGIRDLFKEWYGSSIDDLKSDEYIDGWYHAIKDCYDKIKEE